MRISVDISLYPLREDFVAIILDFIERISDNPRLTIIRNSLSTQVFGEYREVMDVLDAEMETVFTKVPHSVMVLKFIGNDRSEIEV